MQKCSFCSLVTGYLRQSLCIGSRRGSSESYYRQLGDQDTLKISDVSSDVEEHSSVEITLEAVSQAPGAAAPSIAIDDRHELQLELIKMDPRILTHRNFLTIRKRRRRQLVSRHPRSLEALLDDVSLGHVQCLLNQSAQWRFNAFTLENTSGGRCLPVLSIHLFTQYDLVNYFQLDMLSLWRLFTRLEDGYLSSNPYHNSVHAADVTQAMHCFLQQTRIRQHLQPLEIMASLLAAMAHDLDHPGVNQPFLISTSSHLAKLYGNTSVLENHHYRAALSCIQESGALAHVPHLHQQLHSQMRALILATDITRQLEYLSRFKQHLDENTLDLELTEHRHLVLQIALKCADISNPCRPWNISHVWSTKVCDEFFRQGDRERSLRLPISPLCDRSNNSIPNIQQGFFRFVVTPLITEWHRFLNNDLSNQMFENLLYNQTQWEAMLGEELEEEARKKALEQQQQQRQQQQQHESTEDEHEHAESDLSSSSEMLLPRRRSSLTPARTPGLKDQLRRFSVPQGVAHEGRNNRASKAPSSDSPEPVTSTSQAPPPRFRKGAWKLVRQQTFPPLDSSHEQRRHRHERTKVEPGPSRSEASRFSALLSKDTEDDAGVSADQNMFEMKEMKRSLPKEKPVSRSPSMKRELGAVGSQLRDNLTSVPLGPFESDQLGRRKSMPSGDSFLPRDKKVRELSSALPQLLRRTLSGKESWTRRRGSAPSPVAPSELRGLATPGSLRHSVNGGRKKTNPLVTCQQWVAKSYSVQERSAHLPRRSSLPVEVMTGLSPY
ncbi:uncharacterized protein LOC142986723 isoform X2 [Anticarsia gemmatalis]|uniref:uncharacterized protein LOC142986723 isoform X2 n=1 Tax=Anticarsia gemmatalis TaxID=129554 RepID=UPI003F759AA8